MSQQYSPPPQQPWVPQPQHGAPPAPKKVRRWPWIVGIVASLFVGYGAGAAGGTPETTAIANPAPTVTVIKEVPRTVVQDRPVPGPAVTVTVKPDAPKPAPKKAEPAKVSFPGDGMYLVGTDIKPGRYKTTGAGDGYGCYWERLSGTSGDFDDILANDNLEGPGFVTIKKSDEAFSTNGCGDWVLVK